MHHGLRPVLIVEDSRNMQAALCDLLRSIGCQVVGTVGSELAAVEWMLQHRSEWRLAVLDLMLEDGSGFGVLGRLHREFPDRTIVVFSEFATPAIKEKCVALGASAAFLKSELKEFVDFLAGAAAD